MIANSRRTDKVFPECRGHGSPARCSAVLALWLSLLVPAAGGRADEWMLELQIAGRSLEGHAIGWSQDEIRLLARDGRLWRLPPAQVQQYRRTSERFHSFSVAEMRSRLAAEFGQANEVSATGHYLVVHPAGDRDLWAQRFEEIYDAFLHYFRLRGWRVPEPQFPLVAVVFPTQAQFLEYARRNDERLAHDVVGYYSPVSNRILMYDVAEKNPQNWSINAETIIHEAAHQIAFNTGIHHRFQQPPRWVCEGLGTMFEAPGVWNPRQYRRPQDRLHTYRQQRFEAYLPRRPRSALLEFLASDALFQRDVDAAYAEAWALSFFLSETRPRQYIDYLRRTAQPATSADEEAERRLRDFVAVFGENLPLLETHYLRFIEAQRY
jgi:hypothetical protein